MGPKQEIRSLVRELVLANRILAHEEVVDAFGHVSVRHPHNAERYFLARSRSPELITARDIMEFTLDGEAVDGRGRRPYGERMIHGAIYECRPDVHSVVHNHAQEVIPFGVTGSKLRPIMHLCAAIGAAIPTWDIRDKFGATNLLVSTMEQGRDLAHCLDKGNVALMRGHGCAVAGRTLREAVMTAIYLKANARLQFQAMQFGKPKFLTAAEIEKCTEMQFSPLALERAWEYWCTRADCDAL